MAAKPRLHREDTVARNQVVASQWQRAVARYQEKDWCEGRNESSVETARGLESGTPPAVNKEVAGYWKK